MLVKGLKVNLLEFQEIFVSEEDCEQFLMKQRWPEGYVCEQCACVESWYWSHKRSFECKGCRAQKSLTGGTMFHRSRTPLKEWFLAIYLMTESKKGISGLELARHLGMKDERRAYRLQARIREAMAHREEQYELEGYIELDEAFFGGARPGGKRGRGAEGKTQVLVAVSVNENDKPEYVKFQVIPNARSETMEKAILKSVDSGSFIVTDGHPSYNGLQEKGYEHLPCKLKDPEDNQTYLPWVHILISNAKRFILGTHHSVKNVSAYLNEFSWRFNRRFHNLFERMIISSISYQPQYIRP